MLKLAARYGNGHVRAIEIAESEGISKKYLESILASLKIAGLVTSERGNRGGYSLARPPEEITMFDVLQPLEDFMGIVHCTDQTAACERCEDCPTRLVWQELRDTTTDLLKSKTLKSVLNGDGAL